MKRSVPTLELRGSDPMLLEVQLPDLLRKPIGQIAAGNLMDLIELASTEGRPRGVDGALQRYVDGIARQVADIPDGQSWLEYLQDLEALDPARVPHRFRALLAEEVISRPVETHRRVHDLLAKWSAVEPEPFPVGQRKARVQRAEMVQPRGPSPEPSSAPRERRERGAGGGERKERVAAPPRPKVVTDIDRYQFIVGQCMERLGRNAEKGLAETVLVAGVRHAAKESYPDLTPLEITNVLKALQSQNRVRYSAGRWTTRG